MNIKYWLFFPYPHPHPQSLDHFSCYVTRVDVNYADESFSMEIAYKRDYVEATEGKELIRIADRSKQEVIRDLSISMKKDGRTLNLGVIPTYVKHNQSYYDRHKDL